MNKRLAAVVAAGFLLVSCGASGDESSDGEKSPTTTTTAKATTTTEVETEFDPAAFQELIVGADRSIDYEADVRDGFAEDSDVPGAAESASDLRVALNLFDEELRDLEIPDELQEAMNELLTANGSFIEVLDGYADVTEVDDYNDQLAAEAEVRTAWYEAVGDAADAFGTDGVESDFETASDDNDPSSETIPAGDVAETSTASMEVPEGFEATAAAVIQMENSTGALVGLYNVSSDATTLDAVAKQAAENGADKDGAEITGGPEKATVGDYDAISYYLDYGDGTVGLSVYFEAEDSAGAQWHVLSVLADADEIEEVAAAVEAVSDTVIIT